jgi:hypothetical protein
VLTKISEKLGVTVDYLIGLSDEKHKRVKLDYSWDFAGRLRRAMDMRGIGTHEQLAKLIEVDPQTAWADLHEGLVHPNVIKSICSKLEIRREWLIHGLGMMDMDDERTVPISARGLKDPPQLTLLELDDELSVLYASSNTLHPLIRRLIWRRIQQLTVEFKARKKQFEDEELNRQTDEKPKHKK